MFLGLVDGIEEILRSLAEFLEKIDFLPWFRLGCCLRRKRCRELRLNFGDFFADSIIGLVRTASLCIRQADEPCIVVQGIVDDEHAANHKLPQKLFVAELHAAHVVKGRDDIVVEIADHATVRERQRRILNGWLEALHVLLDGRDRLAHDAFHQAVLVNHEFVLEDLQAGKRFRPDERKAAKLLVRRIDGFQDEALLLPD